jgi:sporulation protein YlmC with PRC-barrel domain
MRIELLTTVLSAALGISGADLQNSDAQDDEADVRVRAGGVEVQADVDVGGQDAARRATTALFKGSALVGMEVQNAAGKDLGQIHDLAIDWKTGKIAYGAVSFGGFAGVGDKLFAVPWESFQAKRVGDAEDDSWVAILDVSEETLKNAQGFNQDDWPDMANERWRAANDRAFRATERERPATPRR